MAWQTTADVDRFRAAAGALLGGQPVEHNLTLTITETLKRRGATAYGDGAPFFGWWRSAAGAVDGVFMETAPHPLVLSASGRAANALAEVLAGRPLSGVNAPAEDAEAFAARWRRLTGSDSRVAMRIRLHRLQELIPPAPGPPGGARPAGPDDRALLTEWYDAFITETGETPRDNAAAVDDRLSHGGLMLWQVDGVPVSLAGSTRTVAGIVRVAPVYTPRDLRGRGYGGAVTAAMSRAAQQSGAQEVLLYTDLANPTSNALYQRLGYRPVHDRTILTFSRG